MTLKNKVQRRFHRKTHKLWAIERKTRVESSLELFICLASFFLTLRDGHRFSSLWNGKTWFLPFLEEYFLWLFLQKGTDCTQFQENKIFKTWNRREVVISRQKQDSYLEAMRRGESETLENLYQRLVPRWLLCFQKGKIDHKEEERRKEE